jgi:hypothetical protein
MPNPHTDLADIVTPLPPPLAPAAIDGLQMGGFMTAGIVAAVLLAWAFWHRRRRASRRALLRILAAAERGQDEPHVLAAQLDAWVRRHFKLVLTCAAQGPQTVEASDWTRWVHSLERIRFAVPEADRHAALAALCRSARAWTGV